MQEYKKKCIIAQEYANIGLAVFPVHYLNENKECSCGGQPKCSPAKHPITFNGYKDATKDNQVIESFFQNDNRNIGIATGKVSGIWVMDEDKLGLVDELETKFGKLPETPIVETGKGRHFYFRWFDGCPKQTQKTKEGYDIRSDGGYVIAPPSIHANGNQYRWLVSPEQTPFALAPDWLVNWVIEKQSATTPQKTLTIQRATTIEERAVKYLEQVPPAVSGNGGHNATFAVACRLVELFGNELDDDQLLSALEAWNGKCDPPWNESELRHKLNNARDRVGSGCRDAATIGNVEDDSDNWPTLYDDAYCGIVGEIVRAIEPETEADTVGVMATLLTCCGSAIGNQAYYSVGGDRHTCNLFTCLVGDTASGKGQSLSLVKQLMSSADSDWLNTSIAYGLSSGEGLIERVADNVSDEPSPVTQTRLLCIESEFAKPIRAMKREGNTLSPLLRAAWDGQTLEVMTRGKSKLRASNAHLSFIGHVTETELSELITSSDAANGFANRFLWVLVRSTKSLPSGGNTAVLNQFVERLKAAIEYAKSVGRVERSTEAEQLWIAVYPRLKNATCLVTERARPMVVRLSMVYALLDCSPTIQVQHLKAALALWDYCEQSAMRLFAKATNEPKLATRIRQRVNLVPGIVHTVLKNSFSHNIPKADFDSAVNMLLEKREIVPVETTSGKVYYPGVRNRGILGIGNSVPSNPNPSNSHNSQIPNAHEQVTAVANPPNPHNSQIPIATLAELFEWKANNAANFYLREDGLYWVTNDNTLTTSLAGAIKANQTLLAQMAIPIPDAAKTTTRTFTIEAEVDAIEVEDTQFLAELIASNQDVQIAANAEDEQRDYESTLAELEATTAQLNGLI